ncbi:MAG TPA: hypothetical protein PKY59_22895 [Pyrinomonadaceae bacterium]|nr:hypothetical protein [Pyrinomonadaceae bacterium]
MKKFYFAKSTISLFTLMFLIIGASAVFAAQPPNLNVTASGPVSAQVGSPYLYTVTVKNIGGSTASNVTVVVDLPETNTSPQKYILGTLSGVNTGCQVVSRKLNCNLGNITKSGITQTKSFTFNYAFPVTSQTIQIKATASTTTTNETNALNNVASVFPTPAYATNQLTSATVLKTSCTGRGLTSFLECELFPSSQQSHIFELNSDMTVTYQGQYIGQWDQYASPQQLHLSLSSGNSGADFVGYATSNTCFEGLTTFTPTSIYNSAYKVCVQ